MTLFVVTTSTGKVRRAFYCRDNAGAWIKSRLLDDIYPHIYEIVETELGDEEAQCFPQSSTTL